nr:IS200/IS605 family transposase [Roseobacter litoralis]
MWQKVQTRNASTRPGQNHASQRATTPRHRPPLVWATTYSYKVLQGGIQLWVRDICRQVCREKGVEIIRGVLSCDHVHMFVSVPPKLAVSDLVRLLKGRLSHKVQREFAQLKRRYWGRRFGFMSL